MQTYFHVKKCHMWENTEGRQSPALIALCKEAFFSDLPSVCVSVPRLQNSVFKQNLSSGSHLSCCRQGKAIPTSVGISRKQVDNYLINGWVLRPLSSQKEATQRPGIFLILSRLTWPPCFASQFCLLLNHVAYWLGNYLALLPRFAERNILGLLISAIIFSKFKIVLKMTIPRAVEMALQLKPCTALGQDPDSVLNVHVGDLTSTCKSSTGVSVPSSGVGGICTHVHIHTDTHIIWRSNCI